MLKRMKKSLAVLLALGLLAGSVPAVAREAAAPEAIKSLTIDDANKVVTVTPGETADKVDMVVQEAKDGKARILQKSTHFAPDGETLVFTAALVAADYTFSAKGEELGTFTLAEKAGKLVFQPKKADDPAAKEFTVNFDLAGGAAPQGTEVNPYAEQKVKENDKAKKPVVDPVRDKKVFKGWKKGDIVYDFGTDVTDNLILTAEWGDKATVTFDTQGGTEVKAVEVDYGKTVAKPEDKMVMKGFTFKGWYTAAKDGDPFDFTKPITKDTIVYAQWAKKESTSSSGRGAGGSATWSDPSQQPKANINEVPGKANIAFTVDSNLIIKDVDGKKIEQAMDAKVFIEGDRARIPVRFAAQPLGIKVDWVQATKTVVLTKGDRRVEVPVDAKYIMLDGKKVEFDNIAILRDGRVYLTPRALVKALDLSKDVKVDWNEKDRTVTITGTV